WGNYRFAALGEYEKAFSAGDGGWNEIWSDYATGLPAFNVTTPENTQNVAWRRTYVTEGDWRSYAVDGPNGGASLKDVTDPITGRRLSTKRVVDGNPRESYITK